MNLYLISYFGIEDDPLEVEDYNLWQFIKKGSLTDCLRQTALLTLVPFDLIFPCELLETGGEGVLFLDF